MDRARKILSALRKAFMVKPNEFTVLHVLNRHNDPFSLLISTILSQNTNDRNSIKAFSNLASRFDLTPKALAEARLKDIEESIKVGGLYRNKAKVIKELSRMVVERLEGNLEGLLSGDVEEVRGRLLTLPGIGPKTADILLLFHLNKSVIPVDTHVMRVSKRLGLAPEKGGYEQVKVSLEELYAKGDYMDVHHLLIKLGRTYCKARKPRCKVCPVKELCPSTN